MQALSGACSISRDSAPATGTPWSGADSNFRPAAGAREALAEGRLSDAARLFPTVVDDFGRYAGASARDRDPESLVATGTTVAEVIRRLDRGFSPLCPYLFDKLAAWTGTRAASLAEAPRTMAASTAGA